MKRAVIIVAGGSGKRMGSAIPKQFLEINGKAILMHTIEQFYRFDKKIKIVVVLPEQYHTLWQDICKKHNFDVPHTIQNGGSERFFSVKNGLSVLADDIDLVAIHDGVRPLVSFDTIRLGYENASTHGAAIPVTKPIESMRHVEADGSTKAVTRSEYVCVQTPQCFKTNIIKKAYAQPFSPTFTDDASVAEADGISISIYPGNSENIKITTPADIYTAGFLLTNYKTNQ